MSGLPLTVTQPVQELPAPCMRAGTGEVLVLKRSGPECPRQEILCGAFRTSRCREDEAILRSGPRTQQVAQP